MGLNRALARLSLAGAVLLFLAFVAGARYVREPTSAVSGAGESGVPASGAFVLALDQRDYTRSAVFWWSGWGEDPVLLLRAGANPQLAVDPAAGRLYVADTRGTGLAVEDYLAVYEVLPPAVEGTAPGLKPLSEVTVTERVRYKEPALTPYLALRPGGGPVYLTGGSGPSNTDFTAWVNGHDPKSLQVAYQGGRFPGLQAPRPLVPRQEGEVRVVLWSGNQFLALGRGGGVVRDWTLAGAGGMLPTTVRAAVLAPDGKRVYGFLARKLSWFAWDKSFSRDQDVVLPEGWQVVRSAACLSVDGKQVMVGVAPREQAAQGRVREVWMFDAATGDAVRKVALERPVDGFVPARDGDYLLTWDRAQEALVRIDAASAAAGDGPRREAKTWSARMSGWAPVWMAP
ncbi:MAG: hypothetical protein ACM3ZA_15535 [Bacillota bacterium]